jgi:uncharacterized membrane-anchored protein YhcB (DUF1043 family)
MKSSILGALVIGLFIGIAVWAATHRQPSGPELKKLQAELKLVKRENESLREQLKAKNDTLSLLRGSRDRPNEPVGQ